MSSRSSRFTFSAIRPLFQLLAVLSMVLLARNTQADPIHWRTSLDAAQIEAGRTGKLVLLHFYKSNCGPCKKLQRDVFSQPQIAAAMERDYVPVKFNADESPAQANRFQITSFPSEVVLNSQGNVIQKLSCPLEPAGYGSQLAQVAQYYRRQPVNRTASAQSTIHSAYSGLKIGQPNQTQTATAVPTTGSVPLVPLVTQNPYTHATPSAARASVVQQQAAPTLPANAMPNSYRGRYAVEAAQAPGVKQAQATLPVATIAAASADSSVVATRSIEKTTTPTTPPATRPVAAAPTVASPVVAEAWPPQLPVGTPPLAFDGYCPVSLQQVQKWVRGNKTFGAIHRGRTYLFAGDTQRQKFLATPDAYSPVFSGNDAVKILDENVQVAGSRKFGFAYRNAFYLFSSKETMQRFARQPDRYSAGVRQAMNRMDATTGGNVRR